MCGDIEIVVEDTNYRTIPMVAVALCVALYLDKCTGTVQRASAETRQN